MIGELELAWRLLANRFCAITGTNGKTTVAELLGHLWRTAGEPVAVAGNVGRPLASLVGEVDPEATIVCEASSFQLEDSRDVRPGMRRAAQPRPRPSRPPRDPPRYLAAKLRLFANQGNDDVCVYNGSEPGLAGVDLGGCGRRVAFCADPELGDDCGAVVAAQTIELWGEPLIERSSSACSGRTTPPTPPPLPRRATRSGSTATRSPPACAPSPALPHRLERVAEIDGVVYVNDSKATNVAAAAAALRSFDRGVRVILGGSLKGGGFAELAEPVAERCLAAYLIGPAAESIERDLEPAWRAGVERRALRRARRGRRRRGRRGRRRRRRAAGARVRQLRRLSRLRAARRALPRPGRRARRPILTPARA